MVEFQVWGEMRRDRGIPMAKAAIWPNTDAEVRKKAWEQTGLDTLVVHAVNDVY